MQHKLSDTIFKNYIEEYYDGTIIENNDGFIIYYIQDGICVIDDLFVKSDCRRSQVADELAKLVENDAKKNECRYLEAEAFYDSKSYIQSIGAMSYFGFEKVNVYKDRRCELWRKTLEYV